MTTDFRRKTALVTGINGDRGCALLPEVDRAVARAGAAATLVVASDTASYITGAVPLVDGGTSAASGLA